MTKLGSFWLSGARFRSSSSFCLGIRTARNRFLLRLMVVLFCSMPTASYAEDQGSLEECNVSNARQISIAEAARGDRALEQACVRVTGIIDRWTLYGSLGDIYRNTKIWNYHDHWRRKTARIGLRAFPDDSDGNEVEDENGEPRWNPAAPREITLIGRLHACNPVADSGEILILLGWCHHNAGVVLTPLAILADQPVMLTRLTGKRAWRQFGDIVPSRRGSAFVANARTYLDELFDAARRGDRLALLNLHGYSEFDLTPDGKVPADQADSGAGEDAQNILDLWFGNSGTVISQAGRSGNPPTVRIFEPRWKTETLPDGWACWGPAPLAERDWPISSMDARNGAGRPYACVELFRAETVEHFKVRKLDEIDFAVTKRSLWEMKEPAD